MTDAATTAVATIDKKPGGVVADVQRMEKQFALALPEHVSPERFVRVVITALRTSPQLMKADRESVLSAAMKCAQDGLLPDGREAALVVYGGKAAYLPMIAGVLTKVRRSGELLTIAAHVVYEKDAFTYVLGDDERIEHQPFLEGTRGKAVAAYAVAKTKDGGIYREVMSLEEIERVRAVSKAKNDGPWVAWWGEMARKTVLRRLAKRLPMSTDLQQVFQRDDDHYDLNRAAEASAKLRRLHADFDEPEDVITIEANAAPAPDVVPANDAPADAAAAVEQPADLAGPDIDIDDWAASFNRGLASLETEAEVETAWKTAKANGYVLRLKAKSPGMAKALTDAVNDRLAELRAAAAA